MHGFSSLPIEIVDQVADGLDVTSLVRLSGTSRGLRAVLTPRAFHTIKFSNTERSANSALLAFQVHREYVRVLDFTGKTEVSSDHINHGENHDYLLPDSARKLLAGDVFDAASPFDIPWDQLTYHEWKTGLAIFDEEEYDDVLVYEVRFAHRKMMLLVWESLMENRRVRTLILDNLPAITITMWGTRLHRDFLAGLETLSISVLCLTATTQDGQQWWGSCVADYRKWIGNLHTSTLDYCTNLRRLRLMGQDQCRIGLDFPWHIKMPLRVTENFLPRLETLELGYVFVCEELSGFIASHARTLRTLVLEHAVSSASYQGDDAFLNWDSFLNGIGQDPGCVLTRFSLTPLQAVPLCLEEEFGEGYLFGKEKKPQKTPDAVVKEVRSIRKALEADAGSVLFAYGGSREKFAGFDYYYGAQMQAFRGGWAQEAYNTLMKRVERNRQALGTKADPKEISWDEDGAFSACATTAELL